LSDVASVSFSNKYLKRRILLGRGKEKGRNSPDSIQLGNEKSAEDSGRIFSYGEKGRRQKRGSMQNVLCPISRKRRRKKKNRQHARRNLIMGKGVSSRATGKKFNEGR